MAQPIDSGHDLGAGPVEGRYRAQRVGSVMRIELEAPDHPATDAQRPSPTAATAWPYYPEGDGGTKADQ
jgi:hypothetical protein